MSSTEGWHSAVKRERKSGWNAGQLSIDILNLQKDRVEEIRKRWRVWYLTGNKIRAKISSCENTARIRIDAAQYRSINFECLFNEEEFRFKFQNVLRKRGREREREWFRFGMPDCDGWVARGAVLMKSFPAAKYKLLSIVISKCYCKLQIARRHRIFKLSLLHLNYFWSYIEKNILL